MADPNPYNNFRDEPTSSGRNQEENLKLFFADLKTLGIEIKDTEKTPEKALEIIKSMESDFSKTINKPYKKLALKFHPDKNGSDPTAEASFKIITAANENLNKLKNTGSEKYSDLASCQLNLVSLINKEKRLAPRQKPRTPSPPSPSPAPPAPQPRTPPAPPAPKPQTPPAPHAPQPSPPPAPQQKPRTPPAPQQKPRTPPAPQQKPRTPPEPKPSPPPAPKPQTPPAPHAPQPSPPPAPSPPPEPKPSPPPEPINDPEKKEQSIEERWHSLASFFLELKKNASSNIKDASSKINSSLKSAIEISNPVTTKFTELSSTAMVFLISIKLQEINLSSDENNAQKNNKTIPETRKQKQEPETSNTGETLGQKIREELERRKQAEIVAEAIETAKAASRRAEQEAKKATPVPMRRASSAPAPSSRMQAKPVEPTPPTIRTSSAHPAPARAAPPPAQMRRASSAHREISSRPGIAFFGKGTKKHRDHPNSTHPDAETRKRKQPEANGPSSPTASKLRTLTERPRT